MLRVSADAALPLDFVTKTCAILAQRRKGKTYTGSVFAEEFVDAKIPFVALDPTGAWWGLRASADGVSGGLPVVVLGGEHGDLPLERGAGRFVADLVLDHPGYYVLDFSLFESRAAERDFATAFAERLYRRKMQPGMDFPLHIFVDEADLFVPQDREGGGDVKMLGAFQSIVRRGGLHGLGTTLISQRPALVNKSVLTQLDLLILLRLVAGQDQDAVYKNYVRRFGTKEQQDALMDSLATLPVGEAWLLEPGAEPDPIFLRVVIRERRTFNSSATPKAGEQRVVPRVLADVDLPALGAQMREAVERAKADDPAELRAQLRFSEQKRAEAEAQARDLAAWQHDVSYATGGPHVIDELLAVYQAAKAERGFSCDVIDEALALRDAPGERVEVPVLSEEHLAALSGLLLETRHAGDDLAGRIADAVGPLEDAIVRAAESRAAAPPPPPPDAVRERARTRLAGEGILLESPGLPVHDVPARVAANGDLGTGAKHLLSTLGQHHPVRLTVGQLGLLARRKPRGGAWNSALKQLREGGYIDEPGGLVLLSPRGIELSGANVGDLSEAQRVERWREALPPAALDLFDNLVASHPATMTVEDLAVATDRKPTGGSWNSAIATLVRNGLAEKNGDVLVATDLATGR